MGTLLQSRPVTQNIIAPQRFSNLQWITAAELSSPFCYLLHFSFSTYRFSLFLLLCSPSDMLTTWLITSLTLPMATQRKLGSSKLTILPMKMFPLLLVSLSLGFSRLGSGKLLNDHSSEAVGRLWHLSPITAEPPFPCHRPDQAASYIYNPLSAVTSVEHRSPGAWPSKQQGGTSSQSQQDLVATTVPKHLFIYLLSVFCHCCVGKKSAIWDITFSLFKV